MPRRAKKERTGPFYFYGYCRVSHEKSTQQGTSIDAQIAQIIRLHDYRRDQGKLEGVEWGPVGWWGEKQEGEESSDGFFVDQSVSAFKVELGARPAGRRLNAILQPGDHIAFAYADRAVRSIRDFSLTIHRWIERGVRVHFVTPDVDPTTPYGLAFLQMSVVFAELDSRLKSQRIKDTFEQMRAVGKPTSGGPNYGWKKVPGSNEWIPDLEERALIDQMIYWRDVEGRGWCEIEDMIEELQAQRDGRKPYPRNSCDPKRKRRYTHEQVRKAIQRSAEWRNKVPAEA